MAHPIHCPTPAQVYSPAGALFQGMRKLLILPWPASVSPRCRRRLRWVDSSGVVHYSDKPLAPNDKPGDPAAPARPTRRARRLAGLCPCPGSGAGPAKPAGPVISIASRNRTKRSAMRGPIHRHRQRDELQVRRRPDLLLDGAPENPQPTPSTAFLYTVWSARTQCFGGPDRRAAAGAGAHRAVAIHMKPPSARH